LNGAQVVGGGKTEQTPIMKLHACILKDMVVFNNDNHIYSLPNGNKWIDNVDILLERKSWKELTAILLSGPTEYVILKGKSGRGKSVFLIYLIYFILQHAKKLKLNGISAPSHVSNPSIIYVNRKGVAHHMTTDSVQLIANDYYGADYFFSDNVDIVEGNLGRILNLAVTSGDENVLKEFHKRTAESNGKILFLPSLEFTEMELLFPKLSSEECQFRFDIVGGNPRWFLGIETRASKKSEYYGVVSDAVILLFGANLPGVSSYKILRSWAINLIVVALESSTSKTDSSLFMDFEISQNYMMSYETFATTFMGIVAGGIYQLSQGNLSESLRRLFGHSGYGR
jgi:hypothetical protein